MVVAPETAGLVHLGDGEALLNEGAAAVQPGLYDVAVHGLAGLAFEFPGNMLPGDEKFLFQTLQRQFLGEVRLNKQEYLIQHQVVAADRSGVEFGMDAGTQCQYHEHLQDAVLERRRAELAALLGEHQQFPGKILQQHIDLAVRPDSHLPEGHHLAAPEHTAAPHDQKKTVRPFSMKDKIGYTLGDLGCCFTEQYRAMYLSIFYTLILQVNPFHVGILLLVTKIWDAVNDPIIGAIVDSRKATKGGKFIPWIRAFSFPMAVLCVLGFVNVGNINYGLRLAYMFITYVLYEALYTCVNVPFGTLSSVMTDDVSQRTALSRYRSLGGTIFMTVMVMVGPLFLYVDNQPVAGRFLMLACICAMMGLLCLQITCVWCKERVEVPERPQGEKLNYRTDKFGGSLENRVRFARMLTRAIRKAVPDMIIDYKLSIVTPQRGKGGIDEADAVQFAQWLVEDGVDMFHVAQANHTGNMADTIPPMGVQPYGFFVRIAGDIKKAVNVPVSAVGRIVDAEMAERVIESGMADMVAVGRPLLADPDWGTKIAAGKACDIRRCISCNKGCTDAIQNRQFLSCVLNAENGYENSRSIQLAAQKKKVAVLGGGMVGCETAEYLAARGCKVSVIEMMDKIAAGESTTILPTLLENYKTYGVEQYPGHKVKEFRMDAVVCENKDGAEVTIPCDYIVLAMGARSNEFDAAALEAANIPVYAIGDAAGKAADISNAIRTGYDTACQL